MTSPLAGSLARTIGKAMAGVFLPATLTRGSIVYPCLGIYEQWGKDSGPGGALTSPDVKALLLANSLAVEPNSGDIVALQGSTFVVVSNVDTKPAVSTDPARATWSLNGKFVTGNGAVDVASSYAATAAALGSPYALYRSTGSTPLAGQPVETLLAVFTNAKSAGFSFTKGQSFDDILWAVLADATQLRVGDYLTGAQTYFIASTPALLPITAVLCNRMVAQLRSNSETVSGGGASSGMPSQANSGGTYFGASRTPQTTTTGAGERTIVANIPCAVVGTAGRATGTGEDPSGGPPGPGRWRFYLPQSAFPKGSVEDGDIFTDEESHRYMASQASWTSDGYRVEAITEEVQG